MGGAELDSGLRGGGGWSVRIAAPISAECRGYPAEVTAFEVACGLGLKCLSCYLDLGVVSTPRGDEGIDPNRCFLAYTHHRWKPSFLIRSNSISVEGEGP